MCVGIPYSLACGSRERMCTSPWQTSCPSIVSLDSDLGSPEDRAKPFGIECWVTEVYCHGEVHVYILYLQRSIASSLMNSEQN